VNQEFLHAGPYLMNVNVTGVKLIQGQLCNVQSGFGGSQTGNYAHGWYYRSAIQAAQGG
jgi:hypothetical protein